jgi:methyltransferase (TIGR00027 family)
MAHKSEARKLADTAHWMAAVRAAETLREDRLLQDPWAADLAGRTGRKWIQGRSMDRLASIVLRTRYFDDFLQHTATREGVQQVVLVAAGLDTRPYRLAWPAGTCVFEMDRPEVLEYKRRKLTSAGAVAHCEQIAVGVDLAGPWEGALIRAGFKGDQASCWVLEGLLFYLADDDLRELLTRVIEFASQGSWIAFDVINRAMLTSPLTRDWVEMQARCGAPWIGCMDDPIGFLAGHGCKATMTQAGAPEANHGRWSFPIIPVDMPGMPHNWFVVACRA